MQRLLSWHSCWPSLVLVTIVLLPVPEFEFGPSVGIDIIANVFAIHDLGSRVEMPFVVGQVVLFAIIGCLHARTAVFPHEITDRLFERKYGSVVVHGGIVVFILVAHVGWSVAHLAPNGFAVGTTVLSLVQSVHHQVGDAGISIHAVSSGGIHNLQTIHDAIDALSRARLDLQGQQTIAG